MWIHIMISSILVSSSKFSLLHFEPKVKLFPRFPTLGKGKANLSPTLNCQCQLLTLSVGQVTNISNMLRNCLRPLITTKPHQTMCTCELYD